jgi:hypothetical protein
MSNDTLFGSRTLHVTFEDGRKAEIKISQFRLRQYQQAFPLLDDELGLVALASNNPRGVIEALHPASFEEAIKAVREVNAEGFFTFAERRMERGAASMRNLPPEILERLLQAKRFPSPPLSPPSPPIAA